MLNYYAIAKQIKLSNGNIINIKREAVGYYYRLMSLLVEISGCETRMEILLKYLGKDKSVNHELAEKITNLNDKNKLLAVYIQPFISVRWVKVPAEDKNTVISEVIRFSMYEPETGGGTGEADPDTIEKEHDYIIGFLMLRGYNLKAANKLNVYRVMALIHHWKAERIDLMTDMAIATNSNSEDFMKHVRELQGFHFVNTEYTNQGPINGR